MVTAIARLASRHGVRGSVCTQTTPAALLAARERRLSVGTNHC